MNITMKLTFDGLVRALRFKELGLRENITIGLKPSNSDAIKTRGEQNEWSGSVTEGTL